MTRSKILESYSRNNREGGNVPAKLRPLALLLALVAGCAASTVPVTLRQILPPEINTSNITAIALLPPQETPESEDFGAALRSKTIQAIKVTDRYAVQDIPPAAQTGSREERAEAAKAAKADLLLAIGIDPSSSGRKDSSVKATYTWYRGDTGDEILTRTKDVPEKEGGEAAEEIADDIARCLMPRGVDRTLHLEYGQFPLTRVGVELARRGIWDQAERKWWTAARANSADSAAYHNLGIAFERRGIYTLANKAYENAFVRNPESPLYIEDISRIHEILGRGR